MCCFLGLLTGACELVWYLTSHNFVCNFESEKLSQYYKFLLKNYLNSFIRTIKISHKNLSNVNFDGNCMVSSELKNNWKVSCKNQRNCTVSKHNQKIV